MVMLGRKVTWLMWEPEAALRDHRSDRVGELECPRPGDMGHINATHPGCCAEWQAADSLSGMAEAYRGESSRGQGLGGRPEARSLL